MLNKLSKSRKKIQIPKKNPSSSKHIKQAQHDKKQRKQTNILNKQHVGHSHHHNASTFSLLSSHYRNSSQCSLYEDKNGKQSQAKKGKSKNRQSSVCSLVREDHKLLVKDNQKNKNSNINKKKKKNSSVNQQSKNKNKNIASKNSPIKPQKITKSLKQNPSKKSKISKQEQLYQRINLGLYKSKTNSQINFSNNSSVRQNNSHIQNSKSNNISINQLSKNKKTLTINCSDEYILQQYFSNSRIKNHEKRREVQAAIKIQKVFRGHLTRKMLQQYIQKQEQRLHQIQVSNRIRKSSSGQSSNFDRFQIKKYEINEQKNQQNQYNNLNKYLKSDQSQQVNHLSNIKQNQNQIQNNLYDNFKNQLQNQIQNQRNQVYPLIDHGGLQEQSSIYGQPHDSISQYLPVDQNYIQVTQANDQSQIFQKYVNSHNHSAMQSRQIVKSEQFQSKLAKDIFKQYEQQHFKCTPISSHAPKSKIQQPIPTDFSQKRVNQFQSQITGRSKQLASAQIPVKKQRNSVSEIYTTVEYSQFQNNRNIDMPRKVQMKAKNDFLNEKKVDKNDKQRNFISVLKQQERQKWTKIIDMLTKQMIQAKSRNQDSQNFMNMILDFSKKNRQQLQKSTSFSFQNFQNYNNQIPQKTNSYTTHPKKQYFIRQKKQPDQFEDQKVQPFTYNNNNNNKKYLLSLESQIDHNNLKIKRQAIVENINTSLTLSNKKHGKLSINMNLYNCHIPSKYNGSKQNISLLEKTEQLKKFYKKNIEVYPIQQMVQIREKALQKRQKQMINKLNEDLFNSKLTHEQFIQKLTQIQQNLQNQRKYINKAKMQIFIGYRATHKLMQDSVKDAWYLGFKVPFSQSLKIIKNNNLWVKDIIVDQLRSYSNYSSSYNETPSQKNKFNNHINDKKLNQQKQQLIQQKQLKIILPNSQDIKNSKHQTQKQLSGGKRNDLSISLPHQQSSLTIRQSNQVSQQSLFSQQISYNEGQIQMQGLEELNAKNNLIFEGDLSDDENQPYPNSKLVNENNDDQQKKQVQGFKKIDPVKLVQRPQNRYESNYSPLFNDPKQQEQIQNEVMRKISINQRRRPINQVYPQFENLRLNELTPRHAVHPKSEIYKVDLSSEQSQQDQMIFSQQVDDPDINNITQQVVNALIWDLISQLYVHNNMRIKLSNFRNKAPDLITVTQRKDFLQLLIQQVPNFSELQPRVNQKMNASRMQLLKFMRISFSQDDQSEQFNNSDDGYEEIGKFQHILSTQLCIFALDKYLQKLQIKQQKQVQEQQQIETKLNNLYTNKLRPQSIKKLIDRQKAIAYNKAQRNDLRKQIKKVQFHCIFDALNQTIIKKRIKITGYSGIGLNQLSIIMGKEGLKAVQQQKFKGIFKQSVKQVQQLISNQKNSSQKLLMQNYEKLCENDSQWIYYVDQALSFSLQFVYMLQDQIFFQQAAQISKLFKKH